jgi:ABC-type phosphate transport system substrate-binding protein
VAPTASAGTVTAYDTGDIKGNYDHDVIVGAAATGSSAGVNALLSTGVQYNPAIDYARSSRGPSSTAETDDATFWGFARDGIALITFGSRSGVSLTTQDLIDIYTCQKTNWSQFGLPAGPIIPWDMNSASGTYASFRTFIGNPTFGACVRKLENGVAPFENDVKPLLADRGPDGVFGTADDDENNYLWWISFGNWSKYPYTKNGKVDGSGAAINSQLVTVDGTTPNATTIFNSSYAYMRTLFHVTRDGDADCRQTPNTPGACDNAANSVYGATSGKAGAIRQFTQWLCGTNNAAHTTNVVTGNNYRVEIINALNAEGFQQLNTTTPGLRTAGYSCQVLTQ